VWSAKSNTGNQKRKAYVNKKIKTKKHLCQISPVQKSQDPWRQFKWKQKDYGGRDCERDEF